MFLKLLETITGVFVVVYDGQHALKFTLGRAGYVVGPGVHWKWPIIQKYSVKETKHTTLELEPQTIQLRDDLVYTVGARAVYQIVDLRKAIIEVDNLVTGLRNRMVLAVQRVVKSQDRDSMHDLPAMVAEVKNELLPVQEQWGIRVREFGFSTFSPTPETLEITQLRKLAEEKLGLYTQFRRAGLGTEAAVALIAGSVVSLRPVERLDNEKLPPPLTEEQLPKKEPDELEQILEAEDAETGIQPKPQP